MDRITENTARGGPKDRSVEDDPKQEVGEKAIGERLDPGSELVDGAEETATVLDRLASLIRGVMTPQDTSPALSPTESERATAEQAEVSAKILSGIFKEFILEMPDQVSVRASDVLTGGRTTVTDAASRIVGKNAQRLRVLLVNRDATDSIFIAGQLTDSDNGFEIAAGETLTIETRDEVWAICASGLVATVHYLQEFQT